MAESLLPASAAAVLLGLATGMLVFALCGAVGAGAADGMRPRTVIGASLFALAVGVRVPQRFAVWVCTFAWERALGGGSRDSGVGNRRAGIDLQGAPHSTERPLYWLVLSVLALGTGVFAGVTPLTARIITFVHDRMIESFLWSAMPLEALDFLTVLAIVVLPLGLCGLAISCVHHLCCRQAEWDERATIWCTIGAAAGMLLAGVLRQVVSPSAAVTASALPCFVVSMGAAILGSSEAPTTRTTRRDRGAVPACRDRWPTLLRTAIVAVAGGGACAATVWTGYLGASYAAWPLVLTAILLALAAGLFIGHRAEFSIAHNITGFGVACAISGLAVVVGTRISNDRFAIVSLVVLTPACLSASAIGCALSFGQLALRVRAASPSSSGARQLGGMLGCAGLTVLVTAPLAVHVFGHRAALVMLALSLAALGGTLVLHETEDLPRLRRARFGMVLGSLAVVLAIGSGGNMSRRDAKNLSSSLSLHAVGAGSKLPGEPSRQSQIPRSAAEASTGR